MKYKQTILSLSLLLFLFSSAYCQETINLDYDRTKNEITVRNPHNDELIRYRRRKKQEYIFRLNNINTAYFSIKINPKPTNKTTNIPDILKAIMPGITSTDQFILPAFPKINLIAPLSSTSPNIDKKIIDQLNSIFSRANDEYKRLFLLLSESKKLANHLNSYYYEINFCKAKADETLSLIKNEFGVESMSKLRDTVAYSIKNYNHINDLAQKLIPTLPSTIVSNQEIFNSLTQLANRNSFINDNKEIFIKCIDFIDDVKEAKDFIETKPFRLTADYANVNTVIINNALISDKSSSDTLIKDLKIFYSKKDWDFDFSTGFFVNSLYNRDYFLKDDNGVKSIKKENNPKFDIAIGALGHLSYRITSKDKLGPVIGAGLSPIDGKTKYLAGISYVRGRKNQLAFSLGAAIGKIKALSETVSQNNLDPNPILPAGITSIPTYEKWTIGFFGGITYNLSK